MNTSTTTENNNNNNNSDNNDVVDNNENNNENNNNDNDNNNDIDNDSICTAIDEEYCITYLGTDITEKLQAAAFRSLCTHLQNHSDIVSNIDLMSLSGFCRNCLAKWMVIEARRLVDDEKDNNNNNNIIKNDDNIINALNAFGYDEAAEHVYGMKYNEWKIRYQKKATNEQLEKYKTSESIHAKHDKDLLTVRNTNKPTIKFNEYNNINNNNNENVTDYKDSNENDKQNENTTTSAAAAVPLSNVCCQDVEEVAVSIVEKKTEQQQETQQQQPAKGTRQVLPYTPPELPLITNYRNEKFPSIAVLTISDRASMNLYTTGDLSGPAVVKSIKDITGLDNDTIQFVTAIIPDDSAAIQAKIRTYAETECIDLILTTGGTGFSPRDVTPEATRDVIEYELHSLISFIISETSKIQPLSSLSRGTAGILGQSIVANLPGNPKAIDEIIPLLFPLLLHAVIDLQNCTPEVLHIG